MNPLISLLTDFGIEDPFVGEMKAVIHSICPSANVIDVTHGVKPYDIRQGAFLLASATPYFAVGSVHLAVVDPGVGSKRKPIAIATNRSIFVGPDNGLLIPAAAHEGITHAYELTNRSLMHNAVSPTFHGRDVFAPVAAHLACGTPVSAVGRELNDYIQFSFEKPTLNKRGVTCEVIHVDKFGNIVTGIPREDFDKLRNQGKFLIRLRGKRARARLVQTYSELSSREYGLLIGSHGFLEVACREASAAGRLKAESGDVLQILAE